ncbi:hypothetical protein BJ878DRAFT_492142 [Calycina marina]|uniref:Uncharacterized protein n=1 Tax=Calycina marina TaxID=1763456 RepID=A0A9P7Z8V8_9HELO|nr:hypothetical protein BJ878DRAFT_492142 [Calycina marina]
MRHYDSYPTRLVVTSRRREQRASNFVAIVSYTYVHSDMAGLVDGIKCLSKPRDQVTRRLGRTKTPLSYIDLVVYNRKCNGSFRSGLCVENLSLLILTVDNQ